MNKLYDKNIIIFLPLRNIKTSSVDYTISGILAEEMVYEKINSN